MVPGNGSAANSSLVANGFVYSIQPPNNYYAQLNANGTTGAWQTDTNSLPQGFNSFTTVSANGYVYVMGGINGGSYLATVYYAQLNSNGTTGVWQTSTNSLPYPYENATSVTANGSIKCVSRRLSIT